MSNDQYPGNPWGPRPQDGQGRQPQQPTGQQPVQGQPGQPQQPWGMPPAAGQAAPQQPTAPQGTPYRDPYADPYATTGQQYPTTGQQYPASAQTSPTGQTGTPWQGGASPAGPATPNRRPWVIGGAALAGVLALALALSQCGGKSSTASSSSSSSSAAGEYSSPSEAATAFMNAWQKGDATAMLATMAIQPSDTTLLTDEKLKAQVARAPLSDIKATDSGTSARVEWTMGGKKYISMLPTRKQYEGGYQVDWYASPTYFTAADKAGGVVVDGTQIVGEKVVLLPGEHTVAAASPVFSLSKPTITVSGFDDHSSYDGELGYSAATTKQLREAATAKMNSCLTAKKLDNPSCGINFRAKADDGTPLDAKTMTCTVSRGANSVKNAAFKPDYSDPTQAEAYVDTRFSCRVKSTDGSQYTGETYLFKATVDTSTKPMSASFS